MGRANGPREVRPMGFAAALARLRSTFPTAQLVFLNQVPAATAVTIMVP